MKLPKGYKWGVTMWGRTPCCIECDVLLIAMNKKTTVMELIEWHEAKDHDGSRTVDSDASEVQFNGYLSVGRSSEHGVLERQSLSM